MDAVKMVARRRWTQLRQLPAVATPVAVSRGLALSYTCGAALTVCSLLLPGGPVKDRGIIWALVGCALVLAAALVGTGRRLARWTYHALVLCSWGMVTFGVATVLGQPVVYAYCLLYLLIIINAFLGCSWLAAGAHLVLNTATVAVLLEHQQGATPAVAGVYASALVAVSLFVGRLVRAAAATEVDALTGLLNRRGLDRRLEELWARGERSGTVLSVAVVDLDHFKAVNDTLGHAAGDDLLRAVAQAWRRALPAAVVLARVGGDEFVVAGEASAEQVRVWVTRFAAIMPPGASRSAGVAELCQGEGPSAVLARADEALYAAKRHRRGSVQVAEEDAHRDMSPPRSGVEHAPVAPGGVVGAGADGQGPAVVDHEAPPARHQAQCCF